jgi:polyisoprenyl-phosphate glycosyltransferase
LILGGVQLLALGVIAQYIGMIFEQAKNRPLYILKYVHHATANFAQIDRTDSGQR